MLVVVTMLIGSLCFAAVKAVIESGHPMVRALPAGLRRGGGRLALGLEFIVLVVALALAWGGWGWAVALYALYGASNLLGAWLVLSDRI